MRKQGFMWKVFISGFSAGIVSYHRNEYYKHMVVKYKVYFEIQEVIQTFCQMCRLSCVCLVVPSNSIL